MRRRFVALSAFLFVVLLFSDAFAYRLPANFILEYMIKNRGKYKGLEVKQETTFYDSKFSKGRSLANETLYLRLPWEFRVDGRYQGFKQTWVSQNGQFAIVIDDALTYEGNVEHSLLKDLFVANKGSTLLAKLRDAGIDTKVVNFARNAGGLAYIIGAEEGDKDEPQLWLDKNSFLPIKMVLYEKIDSKKTRMEFRFDQYGKNAPSWYPSLTEVYADDVLIISIQARKASPRGKLPDQLFDVAATKQKYTPAKRIHKNVTISSTRMGETLEILRQRF